MNWGSAGEFFAMGGYGLYVWGSFGMCALVLAAECFGLAQRRRALRALPLDGLDTDLQERPLHEA
jgi:heme exporter protein D